ncbi:RNA-binding protein [Aurantimonas sp. DM33-3]|nr:RNA-binding protein [Aurantimonas sp. DM33-3]
MTEDAGDEAEVELNDRTCIVSRRTCDPADLIRFVRGPDGAVVPDLRRRLPGRGAHVSLDRTLVDEAVRRKLFARAFRAQVTGPADLGDQVDGLLAKAALGALGLARKAGQLVTGATKVDTAIRSGRALMVIHASDAAPDGIRKLDAARRAVAATGGTEISSLRLLDADELGLAFGQGNVIHAAILAGGAGSAAATCLRALATYRGEGSGSVSGAPAGSAGHVTDTGNDMGAPLQRRSGQDEGRGLDPAQEAEA